MDFAVILNRFLRGSGNAFLHAALTRKEKAQNNFVLGLSVQRTGGGRKL
jgi:hypothetical protein